MIGLLHSAAAAALQPQPHDPRSLRPPLSYTDAFREQRGVIQLSPIGFVESPYKERFGTPRQPVVSTNTVGGAPQVCTVVLDSEYREALLDLDGFSHVWIISHLHLNSGWKRLVTPPRGPKRKRGLFATRAPHRPNQIGLSAVELLRVDVDGARLDVRGADLLDGTPVLDLKPYVKGYDSFASASAGWIDELGEPVSSPDRLDYWPPPAHLR